MPFLNSARSPGVTVTATIAGFPPPLASRSGSPTPRAPPDAVTSAVLVCSAGFIRLDRPKPFFFSFGGSAVELEPSASPAAPGVTMAMSACGVAS